MAFSPFPSGEQSRQEHLREAIDLLEQLVADYPAVPDYRHLLARCYREPGWRFSSAPGAADAADKAIEILRILKAEHPDVADYRYDLSETYRSESMALLSKMNPFYPQASDQELRRRSRELLEKSLTISEELVAEHPNIPDYAASQVHIRLGLAMFPGEDDRARAEAQYCKAADLQASLVRRFPKNVGYKFSLAFVEGMLAEHLHTYGGLADAILARQQVIASIEDLIREEPNAWMLRGPLSGHYRSLADLLLRADEYEAAAEAERQASLLRPPMHRPW
jgi:tetratricopeptide (TPR) repeat protein